MTDIVIVDYGMGNIESVKNAFEFLGADIRVASEPASIKRASAIVLPGVGAFHRAVLNLHERGLSECLTECVFDKKIPFLGICLGMQLIAEDSTEQQFSTGLGWINGHVVRIEPNDSYRVPHVGWNEISCRQDSVLFNGIENGAHFYFDHSYHLQCNAQIISSSCNYGGQRVASIEYENIFAVQFHPEKSQRNGLRVLRNFMNAVG